MQHWLRDGSERCLRGRAMADYVVRVSLPLDPHAARAALARACPDGVPRGGRDAASPPVDVDVTVKPDAKQALSWPQWPRPWPQWR